jgi:ribosomal protein L2
LQEEEGEEAAQEKGSEHHYHYLLVHLEGQAEAVEAQVTHIAHAMAQEAAQEQLHLEEVQDLKVLQEVPSSEETVQMGAVQ